MFSMPPLHRVDEGMTQTLHVPSDEVQEGRGTDEEGNDDRGNR